MKYKKLILATSSGLPESLSNLGSEKVTDITDAIEDATTAEELVSALNKMELFRRFTVDRVTDEYVRLAGTDAWNNKSTLNIVLDKDSKPSFADVYLEKWVSANKTALTNALSELDIEAEEVNAKVFTEEYLIPLIESNIQYDCDISIDASMLFQ